MHVVIVEFDLHMYVNGVSREYDDRESIEICCSGFTWRMAFI
jgi:hypothetical protein